MKKRTRIGVPERRQQIIDATREITLERGLHDLRISDVAEALDVSTGLIHYHFDTRDELIEAMLRETAVADIDTFKETLTSSTTPEDRLARLIDYYLPSSHRDPAWMLWIDVWGDALRDRNIERISKRIDMAWMDVLEDVIAEGAEAGSFRCDDPSDAAWRIGGLLDGLALQLVLHQGVLSRARVLRLVRHAAAVELGVELLERR
jgi:AcrR family transcriptional regulator